MFNGFTYPVVELCKLELAVHYPIVSIAMGADLVLDDIYNSKKNWNDNPVLNAVTYIPAYDVIESLTMIRKGGHGC